MSTYAQWKPDIVALLNEKNNSTLSVGDIELELVNQDDASVTVKVTASATGRYYGEETITYVRRDLAKAFLNLPLRVIVASDTTVGALLEQLAVRYGIPFDKAIDFAQAELDKVVSFSQAGQVDVDIPAADSSFVWVGKITLTAANDGLDLASIIANINLTELKYVTITEPDTTSAAFQTFPVDYTGVEGLSSLAVGSLLSEAQADAIVSHTQLTEEVNSPSDLKTALNGAAVTEITEGSNVKVATVGVNPQPTYSGNAYLTYGVAAAKTFQSVMDEYGAGRAVVVSVTSSPLDAQYPIAGIESEDAACKQLLDFVIPDYTAMVVPALLLTLNTVGEFGISEEDIQTIAASVSPERTTVNQVGVNVRTLTFSETLGHANISPLVITYSTELTMGSEGSVRGYRGTLSDTGGTDQTSYSGQVLRTLHMQSYDEILADANLTNMLTTMSTYSTGLEGVATVPDSYAGWTNIKSYLSDFSNPTFPGMYKQRTDFYVSPDAKQLAVVSQADDYDASFTYRLTDDFQMVFNLSDVDQQTVLPFVGTAQSTQFGRSFEPFSSPTWANCGKPSLIGACLIAIIKGISVAAPDTNKQVTISVTDFPTIKLHATTMSTPLQVAVNAQYGDTNAFFSSIFKTNTTDVVVPTAELFTINDRYLKDNTSPEVGVSAVDYIWKKICALDSYGYSPDFVKPAKITLTPSDTGGSLVIEFTGLEQAKLGMGAAANIGFTTPTNITTGALMQFKTITTGSTGIVNNPSYAGVSPVDALGNLLAAIYKQNVSNTVYAAALTAIGGKYGAGVFPPNSSSPGLDGLTRGTPVDVTNALPDSAYEWQNYISKVEVVPYSGANRILLVFVPTIKPEYAGIIIPGYINNSQSVEEGPIWNITNVAVGQSMGLPELIVDATAKTMSDTSAVSWINTGTVASVRMDNTGISMTPVGNLQQCANSQRFPGQTDDWKISGTPQA